MPIEKALHFSLPPNEDTPAWYAILSQETNCAVSPSRLIKKWLDTRKVCINPKNGWSFGSRRLAKSFSTASVPYSNGGSEILCNTTRETSSLDSLGPKFGDGMWRTLCSQPSCQGAVAGLSMMSFLSYGVIWVILSPEF